MSSAYEGRIRPSLIAATLLRRALTRIRWLRGANSPLPHCGARLRGNNKERTGSTRGEFAPPSLRRLCRIARRPLLMPTRGEFAPPSLRPLRRFRLVGRNRPTRGEFAPPSLRPARRPDTPPFRAGLRGANSPLPHCGDFLQRQFWIGLLVYEGRIRPSLIAASKSSGRSAAARRYEGRIRPSLIAAPPRLWRGLPTSPYEGRIRPSLIAALSRHVRFHPEANYEGRIRPSLIAAEALDAAGFFPGDYEGRIRPSLIAAAESGDRIIITLRYEGRIRPSLIAASGLLSVWMLMPRLRGANSPLPHCGHAPALANTPIRPTTRGEFAPPSLRHYK